MPSGVRCTDLLWRPVSLPSFSEDSYSIMLSSRRRRSLSRRIRTITRLAELEGDTLTNQRKRSNVRVYGRRSTNTCQFFLPRTAGLANDQMKVQQNIPGWEFRITEAIEHGAYGNRADARARLVNRRQRYRQKAGVLHV